MRCTQVIGLKPEATQWLQDHAKKSHEGHCPTCGSPGVVVATPYDLKTGRMAGMFDDGPILDAYRVEDREVREVVQAVPWASGPCIFLCLEYADTKERMFEWTEQQIRDNC